MINIHVEIANIKIFDYVANINKERLNIIMYNKDENIITQENLVAFNESENLSALESIQVLFNAEALTNESEELYSVTEAWHYIPQKMCVRTKKYRTMDIMVRCKKFDGRRGTSIIHELSLKIMVGAYNNSDHCIEVQVSREEGTEGNWFIENNKQRKYLLKEEIIFIDNFIEDNYRLLEEYWLETDSSNLDLIAKCLENNVRGKNYYDKDGVWTDGDKVCLSRKSNDTDTGDTKKKLGKNNSKKKRNTY